MHTSTVQIDQTTGNSRHIRVAFGSFVALLVESRRVSSIVSDKVRRDEMGC